MSTCCFDLMISITDYGRSLSFFVFQRSCFGTTVILVFFVEEFFYNSILIGRRLFFFFRRLSGFLGSFRNIVSRIGIGI